MSPYFSLHHWSHWRVTWGLQVNRAPGLASCFSCAHEHLDRTNIEIYWTWWNMTILLWDLLSYCNKKESVNGCISLWSTCTWLEPESDRLWSDMWRFPFQSANKHHRLETPNILGFDSPKADKFHVCYCDRHYARGSGRGFIFGVRSGESFKTCGRFLFTLFFVDILYM